MVYGPHVAYSRGVMGNTFLNCAVIRLAISTESLLLAWNSRGRGSPASVKVS